MRSGLIMALLLPALLLPACATWSTTSTSWDEPYYGDDWEMHGRVLSIREVVRRREGNPAAGAVAGAVIGLTMGPKAGLAGLIGTAAATMLVKVCEVDVRLAGESEGQPLLSFTPGF